MDARRLVASGDWSMPEVADWLGVHHGTVAYATGRRSKGTTWTHLPYPPERDLGAGDAELVAAAKEAGLLEDDWPHTPFRFPYIRRLLKRALGRPVEER